MKIASDGFYSFDGSSLDYFSKVKENFHSFSPFLPIYKPAILTDVLIWLSVCLFGLSHVSSLNLPV